MLTGVVTTDTQPTKHTQRGRALHNAVLRSVSSARSSILGAYANANFPTNRPGSRNAHISSRPAVFPSKLPILSLPLPPLSFNPSSLFYSFASQSPAQLEPPIVLPGPIEPPSALYSII
jgi:hypothetical protein